MLGKIGHKPITPSQMPSVLYTEDKWQRNEIEDMKKAIDYLYEFREKLSTLHPIVFELIENLLQRPRY